MISRRLLRIKVLQVLYAYFKSEDKSIEQAERELIYSIEKYYDLYHYLLLLLIDVVDYAHSRIELARQKLVPTPEDLNPNTKFAQNQIVAQLRDNQQLKTYLNNKKMSWTNHPELIKRLFAALTETQAYYKYMAAPLSYSDDKRIISTLLNDCIAPSDDLEQILEEQSIYWNDDLGFVLGSVSRTIKFMEKQKGNEFQLAPLFKQADDRDFALELFSKTVLQNKENRQIIEDHVENWDVDRVAFMDINIMLMAIVEMRGFPTIPLKVTLNEYIDITKAYSSTRSSVFVNGILDKIVKTLKNRQMIQKKGRGLIGDIE